MARPLLALLALSILIGSSAKAGQAQNPTADVSDHITSEGPDGSLKDQIRYLIGHWPSDFEIAVVEAMTKPKCEELSRQCSVRVKPVDVILGHQHEASYMVSYGPAKHCRDDSNVWHKCVYIYDDVRFEVKRGERIIAMLAPVIHPPHTPVAYLASRLDHADEAQIASFRQAVAEILMAGARCEVKP